MKTFKDIAEQQVRDVALKMLELSAASDSFISPSLKHFQDTDFKTILMAGAHLVEMDDPGDCAVAYVGRKQDSFDLDSAFRACIRSKVEPIIPGFIEQAGYITEGFTKITEDVLVNNPSILPVIMHACGIQSKREMAKSIGIKSVTDRSISKNAAEKIAKLSESVVIEIDALIRGMSQTLEGIIRDLAGRHLLEGFVEAALARERVPYKTEYEIDPLKGQVYDHRPDFLVKKNNAPIAFVEVRRSTSSHASLYAKDKMFSAINWKSMYPNMLAVLITDGPWTKKTIQGAEKVYDYIMPVLNATEAAKLIRRHYDGDPGIIRKRIKLKIENF